MGTALPAPPKPPVRSASRADEVHRLRSEISRLQRRRSETSFLPVDPALADLLYPGLRVGSAYSLSPSPSLLGALLSAASQKGWCAVIGMPTLGVEAMAGLGVALDRLILVPDPGPRWLTVTSALSEVVPLIAVHPQSRITDAEIARLNARLRDRGCTLLVTAPWPQSEAEIRVEQTQWHGLGAGWGLLSDRTVTLRATARHQERPRRVRVHLPGGEGTVTAASPTLRAMEPLSPSAAAPAREAVA